MNVENIQKVIEAIKADAKAFKMYNFVQNPAAPTDIYGAPMEWTCGTAMCVAGWANLIRLEETGKSPKKVKRTTDGLNEFARQFSNEDAARSWLGLDMEQSDSLFYMRSDDEGYGQGERERVEFDELPDEVRAKAGVIVLENLIATGGEVDWGLAISRAKQP